CEVVPAARRGHAALPTQHVARKQTADTGPERARAVVVKARREISRPRDSIGHGGDASGVQRLYLARKEERAIALFVIVERLDANAVSRDEVAPRPRVPQHDREHSDEAVEERLAPALERCEQHFGVRPAPEWIVGELATKLEVVVDLAVEHRD